MKPKKITSRAPRTVATADEIREYAYHLFVQSGCAPGRELDNWLDAERCLAEACQESAIPASGERPHVRALVGQ